MTDQREIKFRAWDGKNMIYANGIGRGYFLVIDGGGRSIQKTKIGMKEPVVIISHTEGTLMQYTGLKDKNGKEIYEGDVLCNGDIDSLRTVCRKDFSYPNLCETNGELGSSSTIDLKVNNMFVKGNIYENPELLSSNNAQGQTK